MRLGQRRNARGVGTAKTTSAALLAAALVAGGCSHADPATPPGAEAGRPVPGTLAQVPDLVERVEPSVVTVQRDGGSGSGVVYRPDGLIVTNAHVVRGADQVTVAFANDDRVAGRVRATDRSTDLAVVQVPRDHLPAPEYARQLPRQGSLAVAIGTPLGFENTVTTGVVFGLGREFPGAVSAGRRALVDLVQTDAPISPGNSGGALLDARGRIVGINEAYLPPRSGAVSIGFAIPSTTVTTVVDQLLADGTAEHPHLGLSPHAVTPSLSRRLNLPADRGVVVLDVAPGGPAAAAGIRPGDVITRFAGQDVDSVEALLGASAARTPARPHRSPSTAAAKPSTWRFGSGNSPDHTGDQHAGDRDCRRRLADFPLLVGEFAPKRACACRGMLLERARSAHR